jgi:uncharacterized protein (DUF1330 family)
MSKPLEQKVSSNTTVLIQPLISGFNEYSPIFAINWFNIKFTWLYNLYILMASKIVLKAGGVLYFKGTLHSKIEGSEVEQRNNLMIVCYPNSLHFLQMVKNKLFQIISILRNAAVSQFCFGFTQNLVDKSEINNDFRKGQLYLVHHFQGEKNWIKENLPALQSVAYEHDSEVFYCGITSADIVKEKSGNQQAAEFFMDGIIVFSAEVEESFNELINNQIYKIFKKKNKTNSLYLFSRNY